MHNSKIIPPNVVRLMPPFVKQLLGYKLVHKRTPKSDGDIPQRRQRKFDLWKPDRMPILMPIFLIVVALIFISFILQSIFKNNNYQVKDGGICNTKQLLQKKNILFVFAHPDDEVMFFSPTILTLVSAAKYRIFFLCLSKGNHEGLGEIRKKELVNSAFILGVKKEDVFIIDHPELQDNPTKKWNSELTSISILEVVKQHGIDAIITFDEGGVSGHINHISAYEGVSHLLQRKEIPNGLVAYKLITTGKLRKFSSVLDIPYSYFRCDAMFVNSWTNRSRALDAMSKHTTQWVWFRKLYMLVSRYMLVNTLQQIPRSNNTETTKKAS